MDKFCQAICAFSNDVSGSGKNGYLIIGVHDNGKLSGLKVDDKLLLKISNIRTDGNILPQPVMTVEKFMFDDGDVLVAEVQPSEFSPVRYRGRVWVWVGPRKSIATEAEEKILTERRRLPQSSYSRSNENSRVCKPFQSRRVSGTKGVNGKRKRESCF